MPTCPVCGYPDLDEPPRSASGGGSYEICPSCGFQFGVDDDDKGISHEEWRARWKEKGLPWSSRGIAMPKGWSASTQLAAAAGAASASKPKSAGKKARQAAKPPARKAAPATKKKAARAAGKTTRKKRQPE